MEYYLVARAAVEEERDDVAHGSGRQEDCGLLPRQLGDQLLQFEHGGVLPPLLVVDLGETHETPHRFHGARRGIAGEVDGWAGPHRQKEPSASSTANAAQKAAISSTRDDRGVP